MASLASTPVGSLKVKLAKKLHPPHDESQTRKLEATLKLGSRRWNKWRDDNPQAYIDLRNIDIFSSHGVGFDLSHVNLSGANLSGANLARVNLNGANLSAAYAEEADLQGVLLNNADLKGSYFTSSRFTMAEMRSTDLRLSSFASCELFMVDFAKSNLRKADFSSGVIMDGNFDECVLSECDFSDAVLRGSTMKSAILHGTVLEGASLVNTNLRGANLDGARVFGTSVWNCDLSATSQRNLVITPADEPEITVDNLKLAQFIYLVLNNQEVRDVIDTITSKVVLIIGRFTTERKMVLDAIRDALRRANYSPIIFDFERPSSKNYIETVRTLASMARFVIADITDAKVVLQEIDNIVKEFPSTPIKPIIQRGAEITTVIQDFMDYRTFLGLHLYDSLESLLAELDEAVIAPAENKVLEIRRMRDLNVQALNELRPNK